MNADDPVLALVVFRAAGRDLAMPARDVREVIHVPALERPTGTPDAIRGFFSLGGTAVTVLDLRRLLDGGEGEADLYAPLVLLNGTPPVALLVEDVLDVVAPEEKGSAPMPPGRAFNDFVTAVARIGDRGVEVVSAARLLTDEERRRVASFQAEAQRRLGTLDPKAGGEAESERRAGSGD